MKARHRTRPTGFFCLIGFVSFLTATVAAAQTSVSDVGLVTKLSGDATYWNQGDTPKPAKVQALMKVRKGDHLKLSSAASLTLLYFASGRQETWSGPVTVTAGEQESKVSGGKQPAAQAEVKILPARAARQMKGLPVPPPGSGAGRSGIIQTMGPGGPAPLSNEDKRNIREAEKVYRDLKNAAAADDITPELYFFSVLAEYKQFPEMLQVVETMLAKRPGDVAVTDLKDWVRRQNSSPKHPLHGDK